MYWKRTIMVFSAAVLSGCSVQPEKADLPQVETVTALPFYDQPDFTPIWNPVEVDTLHRVAPFCFTNQFNQPVSDSTVENKIYLVNFFFTACSSICPKMMRNMEKVQNHFAAQNDVIFISHTVMPWMDSVSVLKTYAENFSVIEKKWHFVTGTKSDLYHLARTSYFVEEEPGYTKDSTEFLHTEHFVLVDKNRHLRGLYNGTVELEMERVIDDIELLLQE
ncbi:MAG: SCO family protein [Bacteroidetes bacterium]|nr:SCO family protein [Bacteroidota bacterium]